MQPVHYRHRMDTFIENLAIGINLPQESIKPDIKLVEIPNWDSLAILTTLSMLDMEYGVTVSGTELQNCNTVEDLFNLVQERKG
jgi:acyl carrier protein